MADKRFVKNLRRLVGEKTKTGLPQPTVKPTLRGSAYVAEPAAGDPPISGGNMPDEMVELYVVASKTVTDPAGTWEFPVNFPTDNSYPSISDGPDQSIYMISERYHEIALIDTTGQIFVIRHAIVFEQPYTGDASYTPAWYKRAATAPTGYETAFSGVDWATIDSDLSARYPGITL